MDINDWNSDTIEQRKQEKICFLLTISYTYDNLKEGAGEGSHNRFARILHFTREKKFSPNISNFFAFREKNAKILGERKFCEKIAEE